MLNYIKITNIMLIFYENLITSQILILFAQFV